MIGRLGAQAVGERKRAIEAVQIRHADQRGHLMDDDLGPRLAHGLVNRGAVESVSNRRRGAKLPNHHRFRRRVHQTDHGMAGGHEQGHQTASDRPGCAGHQHAHGSR